jgi:hypothetical protein
MVYKKYGLPIILAARSEVYTVFCHSNPELWARIPLGIWIIAGIFFFLLALSCVRETLQCTDTPSKESYHISINMIPKPGKLEVMEHIVLSCRIRRKTFGCFCVELIHS